ncbi:alpha/beta hydrolase [Candidatus Woesearchaeota archaeon]|nr:alpha/beta hydrolase [Candidatus Woesearchaeota archaeon]
MKEKMKEKTKKIRKNLKRKTKALTLAGALTASLLTNNSCSTFLKNTLNSFEEGRDAITFVKNIYTKNKESFTKIILPNNLDERIKEGKVKDLLLLVHGFGSSYKKFGDKDDEDSPLNIAYKIFDGNVILADYPSNKKVSEIAYSLLSDLEKISLEYNNQLPKLHVLAHSMGGDVIRYMVRTKPEYFSVVDIVASPLSGINFGKFNKTLLKTYPEILELERREIADNITDLFQGSEMFKELNTKTEPLDVTYNFYVFLSKKNNPIVPGKDDNLIPIYSAYPYEEIINGNFEDVRIGNVLCFEGDVTHSSSLYNPSIFGSILYFSKKLDKSQNIKNNLPKLDDIPTINILKAPIKEIEYRKENLIKL